MQRAVTENREIPPTELEVNLPSGRRWFAMASGAPVRDKSGKVIGGVAVTVDITGRKQDEEKILYYLEELQDANEELTRLNSAMTGRELRMIELKREVNELCARAGLPPRYPLDFDKDRP